MSRSRACYVPSCDTGYPSRRAKNKENNERMRSLFKAPKVSKILENLINTIFCLCYQY